MVEKDFKIKIASNPDNIVEVENFIDQIRETINIGDDVYGNIIISLTEAVNNAIIHGNECDENKEVTVSCKKDGHKIVFSVTDEGEGFDYNNLPDPTDPENLEKLTGRGVFLMKQLSDLLVFSKGGSSVEMHFKV
ncbi:MAG: ATP-binding protein [Chitinophagales bacterium]|nr:ATP-binding protein [Chitinophagales bacterium]